MTNKKKTWHSRRVFFHLPLSIVTYNGIGHVCLFINGLSTSCRLDCTGKIITNSIWKGRLIQFHCSRISFSVICQGLVFHYVSVSIVAIPFL